MRKVFGLAGAGLAGLMIVGCATVDPLTIEQTARDRQTYTENYARQMPRDRYKIAVRSNVVAHKRAKVKDGIESDEAKFDNYLGSVMEGAIVENCSNLGWFDTVDRKNGVAIAGESMLAGSSTEAASAQFVLVAESSVSYVAKQGWKRTSMASKARGAQISTDFRLIDVESKEPIMATKYISTVSDTEKGNIKIAIERAARMNAAKFARAMAARFLPEVAVLQTRGNGQYAQVAMGKNFQAVPAKKSWQWWPYKYFPLMYLKLTDVPATKIDFFYNEEIKSAGESKIEPVVFAHGEVIRADKKTAWVEVDDYKKVNVYKGHNAKVSEEVEDGELPE